MVRNQEGFTAFEVIIILVALVATAAVGYFAYHARQDKMDYSVSVPNRKEATAVTPANATSTLKIKELGVQLTLPESLKDVNYVIQHESGRTIATFSSKSLVNAAAGKPYTFEGTDCTAENGPLGGLDVYKTDPGSDNAFTQIKHVGSLYLAFSVADGGPCSTDAAAQKLQGEQIMLLESTLSTAKPL